MGAYLASLFPLILGSALVPIQIIIGAEKPEARAAEGMPLRGGMTTIRLLHGLIFGLILTNTTASAGEERGGKSPIIPRQAQALLEKASTLLTRYNRPIVITVSLVFGLLFFFQGVSGLVG